MPRVHIRKVPRMEAQVAQDSAASLPCTDLHCSSHPEPPFPTIHLTTLDGSQHCAQEHSPTKSPEQRQHEEEAQIFPADSPDAV